MAGCNKCWNIMSLSFLYLLLRFIPAVGRTVVLRTTPDNYLRFPSATAPFKIALFADLHFGENAWTDWGPKQDLHSVKVMSTVLDSENPDFVVYLGDVITANNIMIGNASLYWDQAISPTRARGIPWASMFGNHDDAPFVWPVEWFSASGIPQLQCPAASSALSGLFVGLALENSAIYVLCRENVDESTIDAMNLQTGEEDCIFRGTHRLELMRNEIVDNSLSYSRTGPKELWPSVSNYVIPLASSNDLQSPVVFLYFMDSGGGSYPEILSGTQAKWFHNKSSELNPDSRVPELIFWHIPSKAYREAAPMFLPFSSCVGSIFGENVAAQEAEMGIMKLLEERPSVKAVFVGHNHGLDWCCPYKKLWLCFARHTGYGGYGSWARGARILEITEQPFSLKSWISMEGGHTHSEVILSS